MSPTKRRTPQPGELSLPSRWAVTADDRALFRDQLRSFVPPDAFDVHAHLYPVSAAGDFALEAADVDVGFATYRRATRAAHDRGHRVAGRP